MANQGAHLGLGPHCGICGCAMTVDEKSVALLGNDNFTAYKLCTDVFLYPDNLNSTRSVEGMLLCRRPQCWHCARSVEAAVVHADCLELFLRECTASEPLNQLLAVAAWRVPWRWAPHLFLDDADVLLPTSSVAEGIGMPGLGLLPLEIVQAIRNYSADSLYWRYITALDLGRYLSAFAPKGLISVPLNAISTWDRGAGLDLAVASPQQPFMRFTIDSYGIKKIERLSIKPPYSGWRRSENLLDRNTNILMWDTPTPPDLERCLLSPAYLDMLRQFRTIELSQITGITFFICYRKVYAIHGHTLTTPCAKTTWDRLPYGRRKIVSWYYIPVSSNDRITRFGYRYRDGHWNKRCFLFHMRLAGEIAIPDYQQGARKASRFVGEPVALIYNMPTPGSSISVIGAYSEEERGDTLTMPSLPTLKSSPFLRACLSSAPLENVAMTKVFYSRTSGLCRGIVLKYETGAERALGECRLGVAPAKLYIKPVRICIFRTTYDPLSDATRLKTVRVEWTDKWEHSHDGDGWTCSEMRGSLEFWFSPEQVELAINE